MPRDPTLAEAKKQRKTIAKRLQRQAQRSAQQDPNSSVARHTRNAANTAQRAYENILAASAAANARIPRQQQHTPRSRRTRLFSDLTPHTSSVEPPEKRLHSSTPNSVPFPSSRGGGPPLTPSRTLLSTPCYRTRITTPATRPVPGSLSPRQISPANLTPVRQRIPPTTPTTPTRHGRNLHNPLNLSQSYDDDDENNDINISPVRRNLFPGSPSHSLDGDDLFGPPIPQGPPPPPPPPPRGVWIIENDIRPRTVAGRRQVYPARTRSRHSLTGVVRLFCTKIYHWVDEDEFGPRNQCRACRCRENAQRANRRAIAAEHQTDEQLRQLDNLPPSPSPSIEHDDYPRPRAPLSLPAVSATEKTDLTSIRQHLMNIKMEQCSKCRERWFDLKVVDGVCGTCNKSTKYQASNSMDPGIVPADLPILNQIEEMMIAPIHALVQLWQVRGAQYKYTGHICNFPRDTAVFHQKVPLLPEEIDIIIMRRSGHNAQTNQEIYQDFKVRRWAIESWLNYLEEHHPTFRSRHVQIDRERLNQLQEEENVHQRLRSIQVEELQEPDEEGPPESEPPPEQNAPLYTRGFAPNVHTGMTELDQLEAAALHNENVVLTMPAVRGTPVSEYDGRLIAVDAFPTLFPTGIADFNSPRTTKVSMLEWASHMIRLEDGRFARHPRFRYWALNTIFRQQTKAATKWYLNTHANDRALTVEDIREMIEHNDAHGLAQRVSHAAEDLAGSRPFWAKERQKLIAQIRSTKTPSVFITASSADYQWPDMHQHMPSFDPDAVENEDSARVRMHDLNENPAIAAYYFQKRWEVFFEHFLKKRFKIVDYWWRYEWQHRGSSHVHGFLWIEDAPDVDSLKLSDPHDLHRFITYWDKHVSTWNPGKSVPPAAIHPSARLFHTLEDTQQELAEILNRFQRHTRCTPGYCLRRKKGTQEHVCRFGFPKECREATAYTRVSGREFAELHTRRNDDLLNSHNIPFILGWRANIDFRPVINKEAVIAYVAKYASKAETKSSSYSETLNKAISHLNDETSAGVAFQKMLSTFAGERDISAQETCHILLGCHLTRSSRKVRSICVSPHIRSETIDFAQSSTEKVDFITKYKTRMTLEVADTLKDELQNASLLEFARNWDWRSKRVYKRGQRGALPYALNIWPRFACDPNDEEMYNDYCYAKLLLHHPFTDPQSLKGTQETWRAAYHTYCIGSNHTHPLDSLPVGSDTAVAEDDDDTETIDGDEEDEDDRFVAEWMREAARRPNDASIDPPDLRLGTREIDLAYDWIANSPSTADVYAAEKWLVEQIRQFPNDSANDIEEFDYALLKGEQRQVFLQVMAFFKCVKSGQRPPPLRINIDGTAGTGKSALIRAITAQLRKMFPGNKDPVIRLAPTGIAAFGIKGWTINFGLSIPVREGKEFNALGASALSRAQARWRDSQLLILDEKSMVGRTQMGRMDRRLRQIRPHNAHEVLGGMPTLFFGDFAQLPPVGDSPLYSTADARGPKGTLALEGRRVFEQFTQSITLSHVFRQQGTDDVQVRFCSALLCLRQYQSIEEDVEFFSSRFWDNITPEERNSFQNEIHLLPTRESVHLYNTLHLAKLGTPVLRCKAKHHPATRTESRKATAEEADGLEPEIFLAEGARVMITRNLWTAKGLVNGTQGIVKKICFSPGANPRKDLPKVIFVDCPDYTGPDNPGWTGINPRWVPIIPVTASWENKTSQTLSRTQFPLTLSWAITIHKSQGLTLEKAVIDLGPRDFSSGLAFVAISRVKTLAGIAFRAPFTLSRLIRATETDTMRMLRIDNNRRSTLGFTFNSYNQNLNEYVFIDS